MSLSPEGKIKEKVTDLLKKYAIWYFMPANNGFGKSGIPDIIAIISGKFIGIECKADSTKKPTALQVLRGKEIVDAGGEWLLVFDEATIKKLETLII